MQISVKHDLKKMERQLNDIQKKQIPFAVSSALNRTVTTIATEEKREMARVIDKPKPFTLNSALYKKATKKKWEAVVFLRDQARGGTAPAKYLKQQVAGRRRRLKGYERLLQAKGILPKGYYTVPGSRVRLDAYGNIPKRLLNAIFRVPKPGKRAPNAKYIVLEERDGKPGGIWQIDKAQGLFPILIFVKSPEYDKRLDFVGVAKRVTSQSFNSNLNKYMKLALKTAR